MKSSIVNSFEPEIEVWLVELLGFKVMKLFICVPLGTFGEWHLLCLFFSHLIPDLADLFPFKTVLSWARKLDRNLAGHDL